MSIQSASYKKKKHNTIHAKLWYEVLISLHATARDDDNKVNKVWNNYWYGPGEKLH